MPESNQLSANSDNEQNTLDTRQVKKIILKGFNVPSGTDPEYLEKLTKLHLVYSMTGLVIGVTMAVFGILLIIGGYRASTK